MTATEQVLIFLFTFPAMWPMYSAIGKAAQKMIQAAKEPK